MKKRLLESERNGMELDFVSAQQFFMLFFHLVLLDSASTYNMSEIVYLKNLKRFASGRLA